MWYGQQMLRAVMFIYFSQRVSADRYAQLWILVTAVPSIILLFSVLIMDVATLQAWAPPINAERRASAGFYALQFLLLGTMFSMVDRSLSWKLSLILGRYFLSVVSGFAVGWRLDAWGLWQSLLLKDTRSALIFFAGWTVAAELRRRLRLTVWSPGDVSRLWGSLIETMVPSGAAEVRLDDDGGTALRHRWCARRSAQVNRLQRSGLFPEMRASGAASPPGARSASSTSGTACSAEGSKSTDGAPAMRV